MMTWLVEEKNGKPTSLPARILKPEELKVALSPLAWKILELLTEKPYYPKELGKKLKMHEQKIYYHIRNLEKSNLIKVIREERRQGAITKYYSITDPALVLVLKPLQPSSKFFKIKQEHEKFLEPFIQNGKFNALIVIGSPEPHGPTKERGHDGVYATNLALFFGTFLNYVPGDCVRFDTELSKEDLKNNLILLGGPSVNSLIAKVNSKLPIKFGKVEYKNNFYDSFHSDISDKSYSDESYGIIVKIKNPYDKEKSILVVGGRRFKGTKAAVLAFLLKFDDLCSGNSYNKKYHARVVDGLDMDNDGEVDFVEFLE
jgi:DNA-binding PadR family transcriptional regulator